MFSSKAAQKGIRIYIAGLRYNSPKINNKEYVGLDYAVLHALFNQVM